MNSVQKGSHFLKDKFNIKNKKSKLFFLRDGAPILIK